MKTIHEYIINVNEQINDIMIPCNTEIINSILYDSNKIRIFLFANKETLKVKRRFMLLYTNDTVPDNAKYINTLLDRYIIYHLFEIL